MSLRGDIEAAFGRIPCPQWVRDALDAHEEQQRLTLAIWALSDRHMAFAALWVARAVGIRHMRASAATSCLRFIRDALSGPLPPAR